MSSDRWGAASSGNGRITHVLEGLFLRPRTVRSLRRPSRWCCFDSATHKSRHSSRRAPSVIPVVPTQNHLYAFSDDGACREMRSLAISLATRLLLTDSRQLL